MGAGSELLLIKLHLEPGRGAVNILLPLLVLHLWALAFPPSISSTFLQLPDRLSFMPVLLSTRQFLL